MSVIFSMILMALFFFVFALGNYVGWCWRNMRIKSDAVVECKDTKVPEENTKNRVVIELPNGYQLIAEQDTDPSYANEIFVGISDGNGVWWQDLAIVRNAYQYENDKVVWKDGEFDVLVFSDENNEDFTHDFTIALYHGGV